jgi:hypothetical protein
MKILTLILPISLIFLIGCAANQASYGAKKIEITNESVDRSRCDFLGEIVGSQGNWFTGDITSNSNLVVGARNDLRNKAYKIGGNLIQVQDMKNTNAWGSLGTTNTTAIGKVFNCNDGR